MDNMSDNQINQKIGILLRREIEARLITQFKKYLIAEFGEKKSKHIIRELESQDIEAYMNTNII